MTAGIEKHLILLKRTTTSKSFYEGSKRQACISKAISTLTVPDDQYLILAKPLHSLLLYPQTKPNARQSCRQYRNL